MRLRAVVISGFKTFARRVEIRLEPGITAIVGPNGSGKSNLVDAIRWALGETNARELRGSRMDEVIYAGGGRRSRMGLAEVELLLDNEDGSLGVEGAEVSVTRRVVRQGDSEYRLNGDRVRLRDLERLLGATGLTQSGYAVVAQNDIDAIIEASPAQRRALVEQAAGVRALRVVAEDTLQRAAAASVTVQRFEDLLAEIEPRLEELAAEAEAALEQRQLSERLSELRGSLAREEWRSARAQLRQAQRRLDTSRSRLEAAGTAAAAFDASLAQHRAHVEQQRGAQAAAGRALETARLRVERAQGDRVRASDETRAAVVQRGTAVADARAAATAVAGAEAVLAELAARTPGADLAASRLAAAAHREATAAAARTADEALVAAEAGLRAAEQERLDAQTEAHRAGTQLDLFVEAAGALETARAEAGERLRELGAAAAAASAAAETAGSAVAAAEAELAAATEDALQARTAEAVAVASLEEAQAGARSALARAASLRGQVDGALGGRGAVAEAVRGRDLEGTRLLDAFAVAAPGDAAAIEAALEAHLGAWIVPDLEAALGLLGTGAGREEVLRPQAVPPPGGSPPPRTRAAASAVEVTDERARGILAHLLAGVWLAPSLDDARAAVEASGGVAVLPDGTSVSLLGVRGGGRPGRTLELAAAEREAAAAAEAALAREAAAGAARAAAQAVTAGADATVRRRSEALHELRIDATEVRTAAASASASVLAEERRLRQLDSELAERRAARSALEASHGVLTGRLEAADAGLADARHRATAAREEAAAARAAATEAALAAQSMASEVAEFERRRAGAEQNREEARARRAAAARRLLVAELAVVAGLVHELLAGRALFEARAQEAAALLGLEGAAPDLAASEQAVARLEAERGEVAVSLARAQDEAASAASEVAGAEERVGLLAEAVRGDAEDEGPQPEAGDAERAEREIVRLERRIAALGPVNGLAPEQHAQLGVRVAVLRAGRTDLAAACADLRAMAARLSTACDERFEAVFGAVSVHFAELFAELFPGGRATLRHEAAPPLQEGEDPSVARRTGVEILAQPPGKRLQPLSLLSGGERALTALAVILALQQVSPSPFYVFDEVDAPLDDSNVVRFSRLLQRLAVTQQFIVVTHNHVTMAAADALHGVAADEDGVSTVISVRFDAGAGEPLAEGNVVGLRTSTIRAAV
ncbi:MAG: chromosome segregation protein SMC [Candidatus Dormibacteria bacterium]